MFHTLLITKFITKWDVQEIQSVKFYWIAVVFTLSGFTFLSVLFAYIETWIFRIFVNRSVSLEISIFFKQDTVLSKAKQGNQFP